MHLWRLHRRRVALRWPAATPATIVTRPISAVTARVAASPLDLARLLATAPFVTPGFGAAGVGAYRIVARPVPTVAFLAGNGARTSAATGRAFGTIGAETALGAALRPRAIAPVAGLVDTDFAGTALGRTLMARRIGAAATRAAASWRPRLTGARFRHHITG